MQNVILGFCLVLFLSLTTFSQSDSDTRSNEKSSTNLLTQSDSTYKKFEVFGGFSSNYVDNNVNGPDATSILPITTTQGFAKRSFNGFNASGVYNVHRYFGIKADFSMHFKNDSNIISRGEASPPLSFPTIKFDAKRSVTNILGGIRIKDNATTARFKPFAHALVGVGRTSAKLDNIVCTGIPNCASEGKTNSGARLAGAFGGGLDIRINDRIDFRAIQVDYNPIKLQFGTANNFRFGIGIVFK